MKSLSFRKDLIGVQEELLQLLRRMDSVLICKSGNLLNSFNESFRRKYFILINIFDNTIY